MASRWSDLRTYVLLGLLKDENSERYTPEQLLIYARWACVELSYHTAETVVKTYVGDGQTSSFLLPDNMLDSIEKCGVVILDDSKTLVSLHAQRLLPDTIAPKVSSTTNEKSFWEWPSRKLSLGFIPALDTKILVYYFKSWDPPKLDDDELMFPQWMEQPFCYFVAAYAFEPSSTQQANIRQFNRKQDSGNPEDNTAHKQIDHFIKQATRLLGRVAPQDRETFYKLDNRLVGK